MSGRERDLTAWAITAIGAAVVGPAVWLLAAAALGGGRPAGVAVVGLAAAMALVGAAARRPIVLAGAAAVVTVGVAIASGLGDAAFATIASIAAGAAAGAAVHLAQPAIARRAPVWLDGGYTTHRRVAILWTLLALACVGQTIRLSAFMADDSMRWAATVPFKEADHQCLSAYVHAAELSRDGRESELYVTAEYREGKTAIDGMQPYMKDQYLYPPPFLLAPRLAIAVTDDFDAMRSAWFVARVAGIGLVLIAVAIAARAGDRLAVLLVPAVWISAPVQLDLQFGQAHLATLACAMAAMLAFDRDRHGLGGLLLAVAIWTKIFPGVLVVYLLARRQWRSIAATAAWGAVLLVAGLLVLGPDVFAEYVNTAMPAMARGETFVGMDAADLADDLAIYSVLFRVELLGGPAAGHAAAGVVTWIYSAAVLALAFVAGRRGGHGPVVWLALLNLAALRSPYAPNIYVAAGVVWMLSLQIAGAGRRAVAAYVAVSLLAIANPFLPKLPIIGQSSSLLAISLVLEVAVLACCATALIHRRLEE